MFGSLVTASVHHIRMLLSGSIKINCACLPDRIKEKRICRCIYIGHIVEKISMEVCSLKADVWYYLIECLLCSKTKQKSLLFIWLTISFFFSINKTKQRFIWSTLTFFFYLKIRLKIYINLIDWNQNFSRPLTFHNKLKLLSIDWSNFFHRTSIIITSKNIQHSLLHFFFVLFHYLFNQI